MNCFLLWFVFLFVCSIDFVKGISEADFYPFGQQNGDSRAPTNDDGSTDPIPVSSLFPFFNHQHDSLIVNTNGVISFLGTMSTYTPSAFPLASYRRLIAPYWADVDTNNGGDIWFRETTNDTILQKASENIHNVFPEQFNFQASWVFVATWSDVAFYGADEIGKTKRCTFQCLLITNGRHSFTVFLYDKIEWTTGTASQGSSSTGLGGVPAQVGFDAGDGINFFALGASRTFDIINVTTMSNIDVPGKFIFRVDSSSIKQGGCNTNGTLTVTPREATMLGGTRLIISGPCFNITETVSLQMSDGSAVLCKLQTDISVTCISPQVFRTGKEVILLNIIHADSIRSFRGILTIVNHALTKPLLIRNPVSWKYGQTVDILWRPFQMAFAVDTLVSLDLYIPKVSNNTIGTLVYHSFITILNDVDVAFGIYSFLLDFNVESGILKLSSNDSQSPYYWTDMFTVNVNISDSQRICSDWIEQDQELQLVTSDDVSPCPCSLDVVLIDTTRFHVDPMCVNTGVSDLNCPYQPSAMACFKQNIPSLKGYDHQCCYDDSGVLMNPNGFDQSGFVNRYHYFGNGDNNIPFLSNFVFDTMPYQHCCVYPSEDFGTVDIHIYTLCSSFYERRPPQSCLNYVPPRTARVSGDPHFVTFDGFLYTFNPVGEFVGLVNTNFTLQLRMEQFGNSQGSAVTAFVAKPFQTADVVEVQPNTIRGIDVIVNGEVVDFDSLISRTLSFEGGTVERTYDERPTILINFETEGFSIKTFTAVNILNLIILVSPDLKEGGFTGLFGNNDGVKENELVSRDGHLIDSSSSSTDIQNRFGLSWRTLENESLFTYSNGRSHDSYQDHNFNPVIDIPQNIDPVIISECRNNTECIYDYYVTGDQNLGQSSANASRDYDVISNLTVEVTTCGFPSNISNAVWIANGYIEGSSAFLTCGTEYYPVDAMSSCMTSGYWLDVNVTCIPLPNCGHPPRVANSSWLPDVESNGQTAILVCNDGFYKYDSVQVNCTTNNTWTSFAGGFCFEECKEPPYAEGGQWSVEGYRNGSVAELSCNPGFTSSSTTITIQCNLNGQWEQANGSCTFETTTSDESSTEYIGSTVRDMSTSPKVSITVSSNPQTLSELRSTFSTTTESGTTSSTPTDKTNTFQTTTEDNNTSSNTTGERSTYQSTTESSTTLTTSNLTETYSRLETNTESSNNTFSTTIEQTNIHQTTTETTTNPTIGPNTSIASTEQTPREQSSTPLNPTLSLTTSVPTTILSTNTEQETTVSTSTEQPSSDITTREQTSTQTKEKRETKLTTNDSITEPTITFSTTQETSSSRSLSKEQTSYPRSSRNQTSIPLTTRENTNTVSTKTELTSAIATTPESSSTLSTSTEGTRTPLFTRDQTSPQLPTNETITYFSTSTVPTTTFSTASETSSFPSTSNEETRYPLSTRKQTIIPLTIRDNTTNFPTTTLPTSAIETLTESSSTFSTSTKETKTPLSTQEQTSTKLTTNETITSFSTSTSTVPTTFIAAATETSSSLSTSKEQTSHPLSTRKQTSSSFTIKETTTNFPITTEPDRAIETPKESSSTFSTSTEETKSPLSTREQTSPELTTNETITLFSTSTVPTTMFSTATETSSSLSTSKEETSYPLSTRKQTSIQLTTTENTTTLPISIEQMSTKLTTAAFETTTVPTNSFAITKKSTNTLSTSVKQTSSSQSPAENITAVPPTTQSTTDSPTSTHPTSILSTIYESTETEQTNKLRISTESTNTLLSSTKQSSTSQLTTERITKTTTTAVSTTSKEPKNIFSTTIEQSGTTVSSTEETISILTTKDTNIRLQTTTEYISSPSTSTKTGLERSTQTSQKTTNPFSVDSEGNYASDNDTGNKLTFTITIVSSVVGVLIFITIMSILVTCVYRKKKYGTPPGMGMQRTQNMHSDSYSNDSNEFNGLHRNSGPPLFHRSWTFDPKSAFPSFENLSYLQKNQTDSTENIDNYHV